MTTYRIYRPLYEYRYPTAHAIAKALLPALLRLPTARLVADIRAVYGCAESTAMRAVGFARKAAA